MTYVDERIVDMRFDNKQFEQNAAETMSTLDKLKEKLQFKNASSGADQLQKAIERINTSPILSGIDAIETKMSALGIAGKRVVENIVDLAMSGVHTITQKLQAPINQIITGGKNRAQNIEQAKFQLEGLGVAWDDIQEDISYGVQDTAYGLDAAAKVASQLVASQVQLGDEMKHSLLGISGLAAMTNSSYEDIGRIFTTVAGNGRLMGDQLLQLSSRGINAAATLGKALGKTEAEIREMVSKGQISFQMFSEAMWEAFGEHAKEANKTFQGALSNTKAALSRLGADVAAQGFNSIRDILNEIIPKLKDLKKKLKPVEDSINNMIESVGKVVQMLIKSVDIERIANKIVPKIKAITDAISDFALAYTWIFNEKGNGSTAFIEEQKALKRMEEQTTSTTEALTDLSKINEDQIAKAKAIWEEGAFGTGEARREALGEDYEMVQAYIDKMIELGWDEAKMQEQLAKSAEEEEKAERDLVKVAKKRQIIETITKILGNLKHVAENVFGSVKNVLTVLFDAFGKSFNAKDFGGGLINFTAYLAEISDKLFISGERAEKLRPIFEALFTVVKAGGKLFIALAKGVSMGITKIAELINKLKNNVTFQNFVKGVKDGLNSIWESVKSSYEKLKSSGVIDSILTSLGGLLEFLGTTLTVGLQGVSTLIGGLIDGLGTGLGALIDSASTLFSDIIKGVEGPVQSLFDLFKKIIEMVSVKNIMKAGGLALMIKFVWDIYTLISSVLHIVVNVAKFADAVTGLMGTLRNLFRAKVRRMDVETIVMFINSMVKVIWAIVALTVVMAVVPNADKMAWQALAIVGIITALYGAIDIISKKMLAVRRIGNINVSLMNTRVQTGIFFAGLALLILAAINGIKNIYEITSDKDYDSTAFLSSVIVIAGIMAALAGAMILIVKSFEGTKKIRNLNSISLLLIMFALSLKLIVSSLTSMYETVKSDTDMSNFLTLSGIVFALYGIVAILVYMLSKLKKIKNLTGISLLLVMYALSLKIIVSALQDICEAAKGIDSSSKFWDAIEGIALIVGEIGLLMVAMMGIMQLGEKKRITISSMGGVAFLVLSMAALVKSMTPALEAVIKLYSDVGEEKASDALWGLVRVMGIAGLLVVALEGIMSLTKGSSLAGNIGLSVLVLSMALLVKAISNAISTLSKAADAAVVQSIATTLGIFVGVIILLSAVLAKIVNVDGAVALLAIAAVIIALGASMYLAAQGFTAMEEALVHFMDNLPTLIDKLLSFFEKIKENGDAIKEGISNTVTLMVEGAVSGLVAGIAALQQAVPELVKGMLGAFILSINSLADELIDQGPALVDSINYLTAALAYVLIYVKDNAMDWFKQGLKESVSNAVSDVADALLPTSWGEKGWGENYGKTTTTTTTVADLEKEAKEAGKTAAATYARCYYDEYYTQKAKEEAEAKKKDSGFSLSSVLGEENIDKIADSKAGQAIEKYTGKSIRNITKAADEYASDITDTFSSIDYTDIVENNISKISASTGFSWGEGTIDGYLQAVDEGGIEAGQAYLDMYGNLDEVNLDYADDMTEWGNLGFTNYSEGIKSKKDMVVEASKEIQDASIELINSYQPAFYRAGRYLTMGLALGIVDGDMKKITLDNMADVVTALKIKAASELDENSPSKVFYKMGEFVTIGLANGILSLAGMAEKATEDVGDTTMDSFQSVVKKINDSAFDDTNVNPVITPVLDLSNVESGLAQMDSMFGSRNTYDISERALNSFNGALGARNNMLNPEPNTYDDTNVVNAIGELRTDIDTMIGIVGSLGFYVDGKQMATAIADPMHKALNDISVATGRGVR